MMRIVNRNRLGALTAALLLIPAMAAPASAGKTPVTRLAVAGTGGEEAVLELEGTPLRTMTPSPFRLTFMDATGRELHQAEVDCELTMPAMPMPENRPEVLWADGAYRGRAIFTMAGDWRMGCKVVPPNGPSKMFVFDIERVLLK